MKELITKTLSFFPKEITRFVAENCWFVSSLEDSWAFVLRGDELKKSEYLIFLSDELFREDERQIIWTIAHEIGHVILGHRNSIGVHQGKSEIKKQENEADEFAKKYLFA